MNRTDGKYESVVGRVVGAYRIIKPLGEGGMGAVFLAQHSFRGRCAALKMLSPAQSARPDVVNRFFNEARAMTSIAEPEIVQIFDFGYHTDGSAYIAMEYVAGGPMEVGGDLTPPPGTKNASPTSAPPHSSTQIPVGAGSSLASTSARWALSLLAILVLGGGVLVTNDVLGGGQGLFHAAPASSPTAAITGDGPTTRAAGQVGHALPGILAGLYVAHRRRNKRWLFRPRLSF